jgi:hypothetical protein
VGAEFYHADGQTDLTKIIITFRCFVKAHRKFGLTDKFGNILPLQEEGTQHVQQIGILKVKLNKWIIEWNRLLTKSFNFHSFVAYY